ncbi:CNNM domain-containing protein [Salarchaeum sp. JOR-1]|uniref:CNNM domain-containing protein n=1 Tax=Salarchaeum sp. JOR-1 TaxID=2599399 RepID=UPI0011984F3C|nr:hemolysin family protein [Salarchaeum sp. JOR-1]QDX40999.1 HlyC/CorC family transporter [Salarchaeum sp. JOR-1]
MDTLALVLRLVGGVILLGMNGFFVVTEFALTRVRQFSESEFDEPGLRRAWEMTEELEIYLSGCQVGITVSSVSLGVVAEPAVAALFAIPAGVSHAVSAVLALAVINFFHVVVGEQIPTYLGVERTKQVARYGAPGLYYWTRLLAPVIRFADWVAKRVLSLAGVEMTRSWTEEEDVPTSRAELRREIGDVLATDVLTEERRQEVLAALEIGQTPVREIAIDRDEIVALSTDQSFDENLAVMETHPHVRFPLVGESLEDFHGIVYTPVVLREFDHLRNDDIALSELAHDTMTVQADAPVSQVIDAFQARQQELAFVVDEGEVVGRVTPTDAFAAVMGEFPDPVEQTYPRRASRSACSASKPCIRATVSRLRT